MNNHSFYLPIKAPLDYHKNIANTDLFDCVFLASGYAEVLLTRDLQIMVDLLKLYRNRGIEIKLWHQIFQDVSISKTPEWHNPIWYGNIISRLKNQAFILGLDVEQDTILDIELYSGTIYDEGKLYYKSNDTIDESDTWLVKSGEAIEEAISKYGQVGYVVPHYNPNNNCYWTQLGKLGKKVLGEAYYHLPGETALRPLATGYICDTDGYRLFNGNHPGDTTAVGYSVSEYILQRKQVDRNTWAYISWDNMEFMSNEIKVVDKLIKKITEK